MRGTPNTDCLLFWSENLVHNIFSKAIKMNITGALGVAYHCLCCDAISQRRQLFEKYCLDCRRSVASQNGQISAF